jgi:two-component system sensor histidine kinase KdpD
VEIAVSDHGPGVPVDQRMAIFEPFRSGGNAGTSGIGLAICRAVVGAHAGTITAGAGADGGAIFTVRLPV